MENKIKNTSEYKTISLEETYKVLETTADGLSDSEVKNRLEKFGNNEIVEKKRNSLFEFILRYWGPIPTSLEISFAMSMLSPVSIIGFIPSFLA